MTWTPAPFTAHASVRRGTFDAELVCDGQTPAEAFAVLNGLLRKMELKAPRGRGHAHLAPVVTIGLHSRVDVLEDADVYRERDAAHREELATHAHGLHYALCVGTPELFSAEPQAQPEPTPAPRPNPTPPRSPRRRRFNGAAQAAAFTAYGRI